MRIRKYKWTMLIISGIIAGIVFTGCVWPVSEAEEDNSINYKSIFIEKLNAHWKLQIPELQDGSDTKIKEVGKGTGISFDNYSSEYFYYDDSDSAFVFNTPVSAPKTVNTKYARSELREMMGDDKTVNWDWNGRHCLDVEEAVTKIPANGRVMVCQVHGIYPNGDNGPVPLKVIYEGNKKRLAITYKAHPQSYEDQKIYYFDEVELNQKFTISIQIIDGTGYVSISSNGISQKYLAKTVKTPKKLKKYADKKGYVIGESVKYKKRTLCIMKKANEESLLKSKIYELNNGKIKRIFRFN